MTCNCGLQGPAVGALDTTFRERWNDPASAGHAVPIAWMRDKLAARIERRIRCPSSRPIRRRVGRMRFRCCAPIPMHTSSTTSRRSGERSIARAYNKVVPRARRLIYVEDQYLWSKRVAQLFAQGLAGQP